MDEYKVTNSQNSAKYVKASSVKKPSVSNSSKKIKEVKTRPQSLPLLTQKEIKKGDTMVSLTNSRYN